MIDIGNVAAMVAVSFGLGIFWSEFLRRPQRDRFKLTAIALVGILLGEARVYAGMVGGPAAYGLHPVTALVASFTAIYLHTGWVEKKVWPWEIIGDLNSLKTRFRSVPTPKVSSGKDTEQATAEPQTAAKSKKAA